MHCVLVSHFHWDREWYRTFEAFRARLVDAIDQVLDLLATDPGYRFLLDGQAVLLEDYLAIRPERRGAIERGLREGRLSAGPWYVQPDSLLPSGESHVRNLLYGRRVVATLGPVASVGYVPDSFGHPAQFPQLLAGFGITTFVYWRGNGGEIDRLGPVYRWIAPDGSSVAATLLSEGYFNAAGLPTDLADAAHRLAEVATRLAEQRDGPVLLMNGIDHMLPDRHTKDVAAALAQLTGATVERGLLSDAVARDDSALPAYRGELIGARLANLLAGVWSTRMPIKLRNRHCETLLEAWAEPWTALGRLLGGPDETPSLRLAWPTLLHNQAHDSICGCSLDAVADRVLARYDTVGGLVEETINRILERCAGLGVERCVPWTAEQEIAVFNPSPHPRTDVVRIPLDAYPAMLLSIGVPEFAPLLLSSSESPGFSIDGTPVRVVPSDDPTRPRWLGDQQPFDVELIAAEVPAFGYRRYRLTRCERVSDATDDGREIAAGVVRAAVDDDGTMRVSFADTEYRGLFGIEDRGDRGDTYDFDPLDDDPGATLESVTWRRLCHPAGLQRLHVTRMFSVPLEIVAGRDRRSSERTRLTVTTEVRLAAGVPRVDVTVRVDNTARDHRLRVVFPTGRPVSRFHAASTFDAVERSTTGADDAGWIHPAPATFAHQGWVRANGLMVVAPGLPEAEVTADGVIAVTLLRAVGWLARYDLRTRPVPAGPPMAVRGAQLPGAFEARLSLLAGGDTAAARAAELGLRGVIAGPEPLLPPNCAMLAIEPRGLMVSAVKPPEQGDGVVVRVLNPTDGALTAVVRVGFRVTTASAVRLDEEPAEHPVTLESGTVRFGVPAHALRSVLLR